MSDAKHFETAPQDRIPFAQKLIYGLGAFVNNTLAAAIGNMMIILNLGLGMNPALVGLLSSLPRLTDAITDPMMGYISDRTRSRWGRRRPYIFAGAIAAGVIFALLWQFPRGMSDTFYFTYFLIGSLIFFLAYTAFATPWVALGYEMTPDYHERTRLMGVQNFIGNTAYLISPYFVPLAYALGSYMNLDVVSGAAGLSVVIGLAVILMGILPAIFLRERFKDAAESAESGQVARTLMGEIKGFMEGFVTTLQFKPFLKLCIATFLVFNGFIMISAFQSYVMIFYVFGGNESEGITWNGHALMIQALVGFAVIVFITWLATRIGKRQAFYVSTIVSILGYALKWFCYTPENPWLAFIPAPLIAFGLAGLFTLMPSMVADVVDWDELNTHERREGMYASIFWWVVKLGQAAAFAAGGVLLNLTGFDVDLGVAQTADAIFWMRILDVTVPVFASGIAIWAIASYSITEEKAHDVRLKLEARRGTA